MLWDRQEVEIRVDVEHHFIHVQVSERGGRIWELSDFNMQAQVEAFIQPFGSNLGLTPLLLVVTNWGL